MCLVVWTISAIVGPEHCGPGCLRTISVIAGPDRCGPGCLGTISVIAGPERCVPGCLGTQPRCRGQQGPGWDPSYRAYQVFYLTVAHKCLNFELQYIL